MMQKQVNTEQESINQLKQEIQKLVSIVGEDGSKAQSSTAGGGKENSWVETEEAAKKKSQGQKF